MILIMLISIIVIMNIIIVIIANLISLGGNDTGTWSGDIQILHFSYEGNTILSTTDVSFVLQHLCESAGYGG